MNQKLHLFSEKKKKKQLYEVFQVFVTYLYPTCLL